MREKKGIDYSTFGAPMAGRSYQSTNYRYGFNGVEKADEMHNNSGDSYDFGKRVYDGRLGRWLSRDPYEAKYPHTSPYTFALNSPISLKDIAGDTATYVCYYQAINFNSGITLTYKSVEVHPEAGPANGNVDGGYIYRYSQTLNGNFDSGSYEITYDEARMDKMNLDAIMTPATIRGMEYVPNYDAANEVTWSPLGGAAGVKSEQVVDKGTTTTTYTQDANMNEYGYGGDNLKTESSNKTVVTPGDGSYGINVSAKAYLNVDLHKPQGKSHTVNVGLGEGWGLDITIDAGGVQQVELNVGVEAGASTPSFDSGTGGAPE
ncbi:MAG: hypothetical protein M3Q56_06810 [Bacteroidota bacterium]|nr:hypothetical protein [Bacteroidota bacterium]